MGRDYSDDRAWGADGFNPGRAEYCACGAPLVEGARFCEICGRPVEMPAAKTWTCRSCGAVLEEDWVYCNICGAKKGELLPEPPLPSAVPGPSAGAPANMGGLPEQPVPESGIRPETGGLVINMKPGKASASHPDDSGKKPPTLPEGGLFKQAGDL